MVYGMDFFIFFLLDKFFDIYIFQIISKKSSNRIRIHMSVFHYIFLMYIDKIL